MENNLSIWEKKLGMIYEISVHYTRSLEVKFSFFFTIFCDIKLYKFIKKSLSLNHSICISRMCFYLSRFQASLLSICYDIKYIYLKDSIFTLIPQNETFNKKMRALPCDLCLDHELHNKHCTATVNVIFSK